MLAQSEKTCQGLTLKLICQRNIIGLFTLSLSLSHSLSLSLTLSLSLSLSLSLLMSSAGVEPLTSVFDHCVTTAGQSLESWYRRTFYSEIFSSIFHDNIFRNFIVLYDNNFASIIDISFYETFSTGSNTLKISVSASFLSNIKVKHLRFSFK